MSSSIYLYAELLLNIRQVSLVAILPSNCNKKTRIWLGDDRRTLTLWHEDEEAIIELPCPVADYENLKIHSTSTRELSLRLAISDTARLSAQVTQDPSCSDPWPALGLTAQTHVACKSCGFLLVKTVNVWKHLPSAGWADMMDFWHCHKPSATTADDEDAGSSKGYAAANILGPTAGTGLVDVSHFLVSSVDCIGLEVDQSLFLYLRMYLARQKRVPRRRPASETSVPWQGRRYNCPRETPNSTVNQCLSYPLHP